MPRLVALFLILAATLTPQASLADNWPSFRGPNARGTAEQAPLAWNGESGENVLWKTAIPGLAHSSPVIWGERLFVTTAVARSEDGAELKVGLYGAGSSASDTGAQSWRVLCLDKRGGEVLWQRTAHEGVPRARRHPKSTHANPTPATDGEHVAAFFGSEGLFVYGMDGTPRWHKDLGTLPTGSFRSAEFQWGFASSPVIHDGKLVVQADTQQASFLAVFDVRDGREIWRTARDENSTWSTPTVWDDGERRQVLVNGYKHMGGYDLETGEVIWKLAGGGDIPVPTPVAAHGLVFLTNGHGARRPVYAVRARTARGDISLADDATTNQHVAWSAPRSGAYMQTPIVVGDELYVCYDNGVLSCFDARTGKEHYKERLDSGVGFTSSPVAAGGRIYFTSEQGTTHVLRAGTVFERVRTNELGEIVMATPAISEGVLYFRTPGHVIAVARRGTPGR